MAHRIALFPMILSDFQGQAPRPITGL